MKRPSKSRCRVRVLHRPGFYRPQLLSLEERLPLGDTLGVLLTWSLVGPSFSFLDPGLGASTGASAASLLGGSWGPAAGKRDRRRLDKVGDLWGPVLGPGIDLSACLSRLASRLRK